MPWIVDRNERQPMMKRMPSGANEVINLVADMLQAKDQDFTFTSIQLVVNARAQVHVDKGNVGPSLAVTLGPFSGGELCTHDPEPNSFPVGAPGVVTKFDGRKAHFILPFAGDRVSIIAFTHQAIYTAAARAHIDLLRRLRFRPP